MVIGKSSSSKHKAFLERLKNPAYRHSLVSSYVTNGVAFQLRAMRKAKGWDQTQAAENVLGDPQLQSMISRYENPDYGKYSLRTLLDFAKTFDVALQVRFVPFSELVRFDEELPAAPLAVPSFNTELTNGVLGRPILTNTATVLCTPPPIQQSVGFYRPENPVQVSASPIRSSYFVLSGVIESSRNTSYAQ
jgi:hypothetical protein